MDIKKPILSDKEYQRLYPYKSFIKNTIVNSSASGLPIGYKTAAEEIALAHGYKMSCHCSGGWFKVTTYINNLMCEYEGSITEGDTKGSLSLENQKKQIVNEKTTNAKRSSRSNKSQS